MTKNKKELGQFLKKARGNISQVELSKKIGVSNKTISEYERGIFGTNDIPDKKTLYKIAAATDVKAIDMCALGGIEYDPMMAGQAIKEINAKLRIDEIDDSIVQAFDTLSELRGAATPILKVGIVTSNRIYEKFDRAISETICGLINYEWKCDIVTHDSSQSQIQSLFDVNNRCHVVMGIMESLPRISRGLKFIPYPGVEYRLNIICNEFAKQLDWIEIQTKLTDITVIVATNDIGHEYISALIGADSSNIFTVDKRTPTAMVSKFEELNALRPKQPVIICTGDDICSDILDLALSPTFLLTETDPKSASTLPMFRVGAYIRQHDQEWHELLNTAVKYATKFASVKLAEIYSDLLIELIPKKDPYSHKFSFGRICKISEPDNDVFIEAIKRTIIKKCPNRLFAREDYEKIANYVVAPAINEDKNA